MTCNYKQDNWVKVWSLAEFTYNNSVHYSTLMTPWRVNCNYHPTMQLMLPKASSSRSPVKEIQVYSEIEAAKRFQFQIPGEGTSGTASTPPYARCTIAVISASQFPTPDRGTLHILYDYRSVMGVLPYINVCNNPLQNEAYFSYCILFCHPLFQNCYHHYHHHHQHWAFYS